MTLQFAPCQLLFPIPLPGLGVHPGRFRYITLDRPVRGAARRTRRLVLTEQRIVALSSTRLHMLSRRTALWALAVIFAANFLNYTDRQLVSALEDPIRTDLRLTETQFGWLW